MLPTPTSSPTLPLIPEILHLICEQLKSHKASLASLARTSKIFENPALDVLWRELDRPHLLAMCLPSKLWTIETRDGEYGRAVKYMVLRGPLVPTDCVRLSRYSQRIKDFSFGDLFWETLIDTTIFQGLQFAMNGVKILPNVQVLRWPIPTHREYLSFVHMFLGPRVTEIDFEFVTGEFPAPTSLFAMLCELYPSLKSMSFKLKYSLRNATQEGQANELISNMDYNLQNLQRLAISNLTYEALVKISKLPNLKHLETEQWRPGVPNPAVPVCGFPALTEIDICAKCAVDCILLLEAIKRSPIESITLSFEEVASSDSWRELCIAISHCRRETVKSIKCADSWGSASFETPLNALEEIMLNYEVIKPLLVFHNLQVLNIESFGGCYISDPVATKEMAMSWKKLESLVFNLFRDCRTRKWSTVTLEDLLPFVEHCPDLAELGLFIDARSTPDVDIQKPGDGVSQTTLTTLHVGDSPPGGPGNIAAFLTSCFPSLSHIKTVKTEFFDDNDSDEEDDGLQEYVKEWRRVEALLSVISTVRQQERSSK